MGVRESKKGGKIKRGREGEKNLPREEKLRCYKQIKKYPMITF